MARYLLCFIFVFTSSNLSAQTEDATPSEQLQTLNEEFQKILMLRESSLVSNPWEKDGLNTRIEQLSLKHLIAVNNAAEKLLPTLQADSEIFSTLTLLMEQSVNFTLERVNYLEERASAERQTISKFEKTPNAQIARVFIQDLTIFGEDYVEEFIRQAEIKQANKLPAEDMFSVAKKKLSLILQQLMGQVRLDSMSLRELTQRLSSDPLNEDLQTARSLVQSKQNRNLDNLTRAIDLGQRAGLNTFEERSLLIKERGQVGLEILHRDVFTQLWEEQFDSLQKEFARQGPDILFRFILFIVVVSTFFVLSRLVRRPVQTLVNKEKFGLNYLLRDAIVSSASVLTLIIGLIIALATLGVSIGPIIAGLGVLGCCVCAKTMG